LKLYGLNLGQEVTPGREGIGEKPEFEASRLWKKRRMWKQPGKPEEEVIEIRGAKAVFVKLQTLTNSAKKRARDGKTGT